MARRNKPNARTRARQMEAAEMYLAGATYQQVAERLNYASESGARAAVQADLRRRGEGVDEKRLLVAARLEKVITSYWSAGVERRDEGAAKVVLRAMSDLCRVLGLDAPTRLDVRAGISEAEFARQAAELLKVTGPGPLVELAAPVLPPDERAALYAEPPRETYDPHWSNIAGPYDDEPAAATATHPGAESPSQVEPAAEGDDQGDDAEEIEIEAEVVEPEDDEPHEVMVTTPGGFTSVPRVPAAAVWGRSVNPYNALAGWHPGRTRHRR